MILISAFCSECFMVHVAVRGSYVHNLKRASASCCTGMHICTLNGECEESLRTCSRVGTDHPRNTHGYIHAQHVPSIQEWEMICRVPKIDSPDTRAGGENDWVWKPVWERVYKKGEEMSWRQTWKTDTRCFHAVKSLHGNYDRRTVWPRDADP